MVFLVDYCKKRNILDIRIALNVFSIKTKRHLLCVHLDLVDCAIRAQYSS